MSLAMYAAPFDNENTRVNSKDKDNDNDGPIARKRMSNNRTQKRIPKENAYSDKVNSVLQSIHNSPDHSDSSSELADFHPLPPPTSVGVEQTKLRENMENRDDNEEQQTKQDSSEDYYKRFMPNYEKLYKNSPANMPYYTQQQQQQYQLQNQGQNYGVQSENGLLLEKLNYMIHLLEEQQDERTGNVTEEVVLYCFLGIFIIFVIDSFVRVGKYVR
jgi:hypothetical protein